RVAFTTRKRSSLQAGVPGVGSTIFKRDAFEATELRSRGSKFRNIRCIFTGSPRVPMGEQDGLAHLNAYDCRQKFGVKCRERVLSPLISQRWKKLRTRDQSRGNARPRNCATGPSPKCIWASNSKGIIRRA